MYFSSGVKWGRNNRLISWSVSHRSYGLIFCPIQESFLQDLWYLSPSIWIPLVIKKKVHCIIKQLDLILSRHCCSLFFLVEIIAIGPCSAFCINKELTWNTWTIVLNYDWYFVFICLLYTTIYFCLLLQNWLHFSASSSGFLSSTLSS